MNLSKYCCFYVSDIHLVTMLLPYINEKMKDNKEFITIFETDISKSAKKVIKNVILKKKEEEKFLNIGWNNKKDFKNVNLQNKYILIMGSDEFIKDMNKALENREENFRIINCFEVYQGERNIDMIINTHKKIVNSTGEIEIEKYFTECTKKSNKKITIIK